MRPDRYYAEMLRETLIDVECAREKGNFTAVAALRRRAQDAREKLDEALDELAAQVEVDNDPYAEAADSDLEQLLVDAIAELPRVVVVRLQAALDARMDAPAPQVDADEAA